MAWTSYWVTVFQELDPHGNNPIWLLLFLMNRIFVAAKSWITSMIGSRAVASRFISRDGNHKVIFHAASGFIEDHALADAQRVCERPAKRQTMMKGSLMRRAQFCDSRGRSGLI